MNSLSRMLNTETPQKIDFRPTRWIASVGIMAVFILVAFLTYDYVSQCFGLWTAGWPMYLVAALVSTILTGTLSWLFLRRHLRLYHQAIQQLTANRKMEEERHKFVSLVENCTDFIAMGSLQGDIFYINQAGRHLIGMKSLESATSTVNTNYHLEEDWGQKFCQEILPMVLRNGQWLGEGQLCHCETHQTIDVLANVFLLKHRRSKDVLGYAAVMRDITQRKRAEAELRQAKEAADAANRAKSEFLSNVGHEIRTPMNGILGMIDLTLDTDLSSEQREYLEVVQASAHSLLGIMNDILDFSAMEAGKIHLECSEFDLQELLKDTLQPLAASAEAKYLQLTYHSQSDVPFLLTGDQARLRQVLINLISNAIKFTEQGEVAIHISVESRTLDSAILHFSVADTGIGIPAEKQLLIFDAFVQADGSSTRKHGGTGLGLAIASRLVDLMGGRIWIESEMNKGSTFHFTARFDLPRHVPPMVETPSELSLQGLPVLIVDDNPTNRLFLEQVLRQWDMRPTSVASGKDALAELLRRADQGNPYPLVLLDALMPEMDGLTLARMILRQHGLVNTALVLLTSKMHTAHDRRYRENGFIACLSKPLKRSELLQTLLHALSQSSMQVKVPAEDEKDEPLSETEIARRSFSILFVEELAVDQQMAVRMLKKHGHNVITASSGNEALAVLDQDPIDVVLMDIRILEEDGLEVAATLRRREADTAQHVPIIVLATAAMQKDRELCLAAGLDAYMTKPIQLPTLMQTLQNLIPRTTQEDPARSIPCTAT